MVIHHVGIHRGDTVVNGDAAASPFTEGILAMTGMAGTNCIFIWLEPGIGGGAAIALPPTSLILLGRPAWKSAYFQAI